MVHYFIGQNERTIGKGVAIIILFKVQLHNLGQSAFVRRFWRIYSIPAPLYVTFILLYKLNNPNTVVWLSHTVVISQRLVRILNVSYVWDSFISCLLRSIFSFYKSLQFCGSFFINHFHLTDFLQFKTWEQHNNFCEWLNNIYSTTSTQQCYFNW